MNLRPVTRRVVLVYCHPSEESFTAAARDRVLAGLAAAGREVRLHDLYAEAWETDGDDAIHHADLAWCDTLVFVYPTWWAGQPGMLDDWIVRCWPTHVRRPNIRRIAAVSSHGSRKWVNALEGEVGKHRLARWVRPRCGWSTRFDWVPLYDIDTATEERRRAFLARVEQRFADRY